LPPVVNFINIILPAAFAQIFFAKKLQSQTVIREKLCKALLYKKEAYKILMKLQQGDAFENKQGLNYRVFHGFGQSKFAHGGLILGSSQFTLLPQLPFKTIISLKVVRN